MFRSTRHFALSDETLADAYVYSPQAGWPREFFRVDNFGCCSELYPPLSFEIKRHLFDMLIALLNSLNREEDVGDVIFYRLKIAMIDFIADKESVYLLDNDFYTKFDFYRLYKEDYTFLSSATTIVCFDAYCLDRFVDFGKNCNIRTAIFIDNRFSDGEDYLRILERLHHLKNLFIRNRISNKVEYMRNIFKSLRRVNDLQMFGICVTYRLVSVEEDFLSAIADVTSLRGLSLAGFDWSDAKKNTALANAVLKNNSLTRLEIDGLSDDVCLATIIKETENVRSLRFSTGFSYVPIASALESNISIVDIWPAYVEFKNITNRNSKFYSRKNIESVAVELTLALSAHLVPYVLLEVMEWLLPYMYKVSHRVKIDKILAVEECIKNIRLFH